MRLTHPARKWQLAFALTATFGAAPASAENLRCGAVRALLDGPTDVYVVGELPDSLSSEDAESAVRSASQAWSDVTCSTATLRAGGRVQSVDEAADGIAVIFTNPAADRCFASASDIAWTLLSPCCNSAAANRQNCEGDWYLPGTVLLNARDYDWRPVPEPYQQPNAEFVLTVDLASVLTHELGHALGLSHDETDPLATMAPRYLRDGGLATLSASDKARLCTLYPGGAPECDADADCPALGSCEQRGDFRVCEEHRGEMGDFCALDDLVCDCLLTSAPTFSGYCTEPCDDDDDCPSDAHCEAADLGGRCELTAVPIDPTCAVGGYLPAKEPLALWLTGLLISASARRRASRSQQSRPRGSSR